MPASHKLALSALFFALFLNSLLGISALPYLKKAYFQGGNCDDSRIIRTMLYKDAYGVLSRNGFVVDDWDISAKGCYRTRENYQTLQKEGLTALNAYLENRKTYVSAPGLGTLLLYPFWRASQKAFHSSSSRLYFGLWTLRTVSSLSTAAVLVLLCLWIRREVGLFSALLVGSVVLLPFSAAVFLYFMGRSPIYKPFMLFLPFLLVAFAMQSPMREKIQRGLSVVIVSTLAGGAVFLKILFGWGYDLLAPVMVSATIPVFWYALREQWSLRQFLLWFCAVSCGVLLGFLLAFLAHAMQAQALGINFFEFAKNKFLWRFGGHDDSGTALECLGGEVSSAGCRNRLHGVWSTFVYQVPAVFVCCLPLFSKSLRDSVRERLRDSEQRRLAGAILVCVLVGALAAASQPLTFKQATLSHFWWKTSCWQLMFRPFLFMLLAYVCEPSLARWAARVSARWVGRMSERSTNQQIGGVGG